MMAQDACVISVCLASDHRFSKALDSRIRLLQGQGVEGDAHCGVTVRHRSRVARDPSQPNLRQVHLIHAELFTELRAAGHAVEPGDLGENITTRGIDLLALPAGTRLALGDSAIIEITGLRNPCAQIDRFQPGLMKAVLGRDEQGGLVRKAGVMAVVVEGGWVVPGDAIAAVWPAKPWQPLVPV